MTFPPKLINKYGNFGVPYIRPKEALNQDIYFIVHFKCIESNILITDVSVNNKLSTKSVSLVK